MILDDKKRKMFGFFPLLASFSKGQIGALNADSYLERVNSVGKIIMKNDSTLIGDELLDKLVTFHMNASFMKHMQMHHAKHVGSKQPFGRTVVRDSD